MNSYFINITKNLDLKPSIVLNTSEIDVITFWRSYQCMQNKGGL